MDKRSGAIIRDAAQAIERYGWVQHMDGSPDEGMCIRGAINYIEMLQDRSRQVLPVSAVSTNSWWSSEAEFSQWMDSIGQYEGICRANEQLVTTPYGSFVPCWNDWPERTKEEVLLYMNKFADEVDPQGP